MASQPRKGTGAVRFFAVVFSCAAFAAADVGPGSPVSSEAPRVVKTWVGNTSADWSDGANWSPVGAPASGDDVVVDSTAGANQPTFTGSGTVSTLALSNGVTLTIATASTLTVTVSATCASSTLSLAGTGSLSTPTYGVSTNATSVLSGTGVLSADVTVSNPATLSVAGSTTITGSLTVGSSAVVGVSNSLAIEGNLDISGTLSGAGTTTLSGNTSATIDVSGSTTISCLLLIQKNSTAETVTLVDAGTTTLAGRLEVGGGTLRVDAGKTLVVNGANPSVAASRGLIELVGGTAALTATNGLTFSGSGALIGDGTVNGAVTVTGASASFDAGTATFTGAVIVQSGAIFTVGGTGTLTLNVSVALSGTLRVDGLLNFGGGASTPSIVSTGGTLDVDGTATVGNGVSFAGNSVLSGGGTLASSAAVLSGTTVVSTGASPTVSGGVTIASGATLDVDGQLFASGGVVSTNGNLTGAGTLSGVFVASTGTSSVGTSAALTIDDAVTVSAGATLAVAAGSTLDATGPSPSVRVSLGGAGATLVVDGTLNATNGVALEGASTLGGTGSITASSAIGASVSAGTTTISGSANLSITSNVAAAVDVPSGSTFVVASGGVLAANGTPNAVAITDATLTVAGSLNATNGVVFDGAATLSAAGTIGGGATVATGTATLGGAANLSGGLTVAGGAVLALGGFDLTAAGDLTVGGTLSGAGTLNLSGDATSGVMSVTGTLSSATSIVAGGGAAVGVTLGQAATTLGGTLAVAGGSLTVGAGQSLAVAAGISVSGGTLTVDGTTTGGAFVTCSGGTLDGAATGVVSQGVDLTGPADVAFSGRVGGTLRASSGSATISGAPKAASALPTNCEVATSIEVQLGATLTISGAPEAAGDVLIDGALVLSGGAQLRVFSDVTISGTGSASGAGAFSFDAFMPCGAQTLTGTTSAGVTLTGDAGFNGAGAVLNGAFTVGAAATVNVPGATTLTVGGLFTLDSGTLVVDGTLIATGGFAVTGTRSLSGTGTIDASLTVSNGAATFPAGSSLTITGSLTLQSSGSASIQSSTTVQGQIVVGVGGTLDVAAGVTLTGSFSAPSLSVEGGAVTVAATGVLQLADGARTQTASGSFVVDGTMNATAGALEIRSATNLGGTGVYNPVLDVATATATFPAASTPSFPLGAVVGGGGGLVANGDPDFGVVGVAANGATQFGGSGSIAGFVDVQTGTATVIAPATLTFVDGASVGAGANLSVGAGATLTLGVAAPALAFVGGALDVDGVLTSPLGATFDGASFLRGDGSFVGGVTINTGTTTVDGSSAVTVDGALTVASGATFAVATGSTANVTSGVAPAIALDGGALDVDGGVTAALGVVASGAVEFDGDGTVTAPTSIVPGPFALVGSKTTILSGSNLTFVGTFNVDPTATCLFASSASIDGATTVSGSLIVDAGVALTVTAAAPAVSILGAALEVRAGGSLAATTETRFSGASTLTGPGSIGSPARVDSGTTTSSTTTVAFAGGLVVANGATLALSFDVDVSGDLVVETTGTVSGAVSMRLFGATPASSFAVEGSLAPTVTIDAGVDSVAAAAPGGSTTLGGPLSVQSGTFSIPVGQTLAATSVVVASAGVLAVDGDLSGGAVQLSGVLSGLPTGVIAPTVDVSGAADLALSGRVAGLCTVLTGATATVSGGAVFATAAPATCEAGTTSLVVQAGAALTIFGAPVAAGDVSIAGDVVLNPGTLNVHLNVVVVGAGTLTGTGALGLVADAPCAKQALSGSISVSIVASGSAGTTFGPGATTLNQDVTVSGSNIFCVPAGATVTVNGSVNASGGGFDVDGDLISVGGFAVAASTTFDGAGTFQGAFVVSGGTAQFLTGSSLTLQNGLSLSGGSASFASAAGTTVTGQIVVPTGATLGTLAGGSLTAAFAGGPSILATGGTVDVDAGGTATVQNGAAAQTTPSVFDVDGAFNAIGGSLVLDVGATLSGGGTYGLPVVANAVVTVPSGEAPTFGSTFDVAASGGLDVAGSPTFSGALTCAGALGVQGGGVATANAAAPGATFNGATADVDGTFATANGLVVQGTTSFDGVGQINGATTIQSGTTTVVAASALQFGGAFTIDSGATATYASTTGVSGAFVANGAAIVSTGATLTLGGAAPAGVVSGGSLDVDGTLAAANGLSFQGASTLDGDGTVAAPTTIAGGTTTIVALSSLDFPVGAPLTVDPGATLDVFAAVTASDATTVAGTLAIEAGAVFSANGPAPSCAVNGGTVDLDGTLATAAGVASNGMSTFSGTGGTVVGSTSFSGGPAVVAVGATPTFDGDWTLPPASIVQVSGQAVVTGVVSSSGTITVIAGGMLTVSGAAPAISQSNGSIFVDGQLVAPGGVTTQGAVSLLGTGLFDTSIAVASGVASVLAPSTPTFRALTIGTLAQALFTTQVGSSLTIADAGAGLLLVLSTAPQSSAAFAGAATIDVATVAGLIGNGDTLNVLGLMTLQAGSQGTFNGPTTAANVEANGTSTSSSSFDVAQTLGVRAGATATFSGATTAQTLEVDGQTTTNATVVVSGLCDVRAGGVLTTNGASTFGTLTVAGACSTAANPAASIHVLGDATVDGAAATLTTSGPSVLDVDGATFVRNGGTFDGTGGSHLFGGALDCTPSGTLVHDPATIFTFDGATNALVSCPTLPEVRCAKASGSSLTLPTGTSLSAHLRGVSGDLVLDGGGSVSIAGSLFGSGGTFATANGAIADVAGNVVFDAPAPAATGIADVEVAGDWSANASFAPSAGVVRFDGAAQAIGAAGPYAGPLFFFACVVNASSTTTLGAPVQFRGSLDVSGALTVSGATLGAVPFVLEARDDFAIGTGGVYAPGGLPTNVAGSFSCANPAGLPQSSTATSTVFHFGASADFVSNPVPAAPGPLNRATVVAVDAPLPSVVVAVRGPTATIQLAEFAVQACPGGDAACTTARALRVFGSFTQSSDAGATTLVHSSSSASPTPSFTLDVAGPATFSGGEFLCCTVTDFLVTRSSTTWSGGTCTTLANILALGDWTANAAFRPSQGVVELRGDGVLDSTAPDGSAFFAALKITAPSGSTATRTVFETVRLGSGVGGIPAPQVTIASGTTLSAAAFGTSTAPILRSIDAVYTVLGTLNVGGGGAIEFGPTSTLNIPAGAVLRLRALSSEPRATLRAAAGAAGFALTIGGTLDADRFAIEDPASTGIIVQSGATLASFSDGLFRRTSTPVGTSVLLDLRRPASTTPFVVTGMQFGDAGLPTAASNQSTGALNVRTQLSSADIQFETWTGVLGGNFLDDDPFENSPLYAANGGKVRWGAPAATVIGSFAAAGGPSRVTASWTTTLETPGATFDVERAPAPTGPFVLAGSAPCTGAGAYWCVDEPLQPGATYWYRLVENVAGSAPRVLGTASATPIFASFASAPNVFEVGAGGAYATPQAAIDAAVTANVPRSIVRLLPGTYPAFAIVATPPLGLSVIADGGPVVVDTTLGPISISGLGPAARVVLQGLDVGSASSPHAAIVVASCAAPILVADCALFGGVGKPALRATASYGIALDDVACLGTPGLSLIASVAAAWNGSSNATELANGAALREAGFNAGVASIDGLSARTTYPGVAPTLDVAPFASIGVPATFTFVAEPNAPYVFVASLDLGFVNVVAAPVDLPLMIGLASTWFFFEAATDATGVSTFAVFVPPDPALIGFSPVFQGAAYVPSVGRYRCSSPAPTTLAP